MSEYLIDSSIEPASNISFNLKDDEVLRLDKDGFHYKGQTIDDAGEAHLLFTRWMKKAMGESDDI